ncbi:MAG: MbnP family protein [Bacteroidota bacterium]
MKYSYYLLLFCLLGFAACDDDEVIPADTTDLALTFKGTYNGEPLQMLKTYDYDGTPIRFQRFDFYISDLSLIKDDPSGSGELELKEIDFIDLSYDAAADASAGFRLDLPEVQTGAYTGLKMGIGVPPDLNKTEWTDYASGHPLNDANHYWKGWNSFIFAKVEGAIDADGDGMFEQSFTFHAGRDTVYFDHSLLANIQLDVTSAASFDIEVDVFKLFSNPAQGCDGDGNNLVDLDEDDCSRSHSSDSELEQVLKMMRNFNNALTVRN